jgi:hypothetical protein
MEGEVMTPDDQQRELRAENSVLRGALFLTTLALRKYYDAPHFEIDDEGVEKLEVIVLPSTREKAGDAINRANQLLREPEGQAR